jgi:putative PIN family toxin of toxin-antitoxin system
MKIVLDCNVLVTSLSSRSPYNIIYKSLVSGKFELIASNDVLLEYEEIIQLKYGIETSISFMSLLSLLPNVLYVHPYYRWNLITVDPDDNKYCDCAVSGTADFIVTEDKHFNILKGLDFPPLQVIDTVQFLDLLGKS